LTLNFRAFLSFIIHHYPLLINDYQIIIFSRSLLFWLNVGLYLHFMCESAWPR